MKILYVYLVLINLAALVLMAEDKRRAKRRLWRIRERTLFALALLGGSVGALLACICSITRPGTGTSWWVCR